MCTERSLRTGLILLLLFSACGLIYRLNCTFARRGVPARTAAYGTTSNRENAPRTPVSFGRLPLGFEANQGQTDARVKFFSRGPGYALFLTQDETVLRLDGPKKSSMRHGAPGPNQITGPSPRRAETVDLVRLAFVNSNRAAAVEGVAELPGKSNYLLGSNSATWQKDVARYAKVRYRGLYSGVDAVYYGHEGRIEYDLILSPGADPRPIQFSLKGQPSQPARRSLRLAANGDLAIGTGAGQLRLRKPQAYQWTAEPDSGSGVKSRRQAVEARYVIRKSGTVAFELGAYDASRSLVIDPELTYSSYLGGSEDDEGNGIAVDASGNVYVTGQTASLNFPVTGGVFQSVNAGSEDVFVTKFDPAGNELVYSSYLGGSNFDSGQGIAVDGGGNAYLTGYTCSSDFPTTPGAFRTTYSGTNGDCEVYGGDAFVTKLNPGGSALVYSTYLGSSGSDIGYAISVNASGNAYVTGLAGAANFPTTPGAAQDVFGGGFDAFAAELEPDGSGLVYSTFAGGKYGDLAYAIALDRSGDAFIGGYTNSPNFPVTSQAFQTTLNAPTAGFVTKLNPQGTAFTYSTYLGGSGSGVAPCATCVTGIALNPAGAAFISGLTWETNFPVTRGAFQPKFAGGYHDAFVAELNAGGTALQYASYLGGNGDDGAVAIALDGAGNIYLRGNTYSTNFPVTSNAFQSTNAGGSDSFLAQVGAGGRSLLYSTYLGGSGDEFAKATRSLALRGSVNPIAYITGYSDSTNFPVSSGAFQPSYGGGTYDAFVSEFNFGLSQGAPSNESGSRSKP
jgi:Beta-propeller repeat